MYLKRLFLLSLLLGTALNAEVEDKWKINVGGMFVTSFETDMQLSKKGFPVGARINTEDQLGLNSDTATFRLDGYYRFNDQHAIEGSYYAVRSDGERVVSGEFEWNGDIIGAGARVDSFFDMDILKVNYLYSFYHNDRVELALSAGLHLTSIDLGISASGSVNGIPSKTVSSGSSVTAPLPVVGFKGQYTIIPETLFIDYKADFFYLEFDTYTGSLIRSLFAIEYRFVEHVGVGLGFDSTIINVEMDDGDKKVNVDNTLSGFLLYFTYIY